MMVPSSVVLALISGLVLEAIAIHLLDRRAIRREAQFWEDLRLRALDGYGRVFDWSDEDDL